MSSDGRLAFVSNWGNGTLSVVDLAEQTVIKTLTVGDEPAGVDYLGACETGCE